MKQSDSTEKNKSEIKFPHDAGIKSAFRKRELARNFFENYLSEKVVRHLDLNHLELVNKSYVDEKLKEKHSDIPPGLENG